MKHSFTRRDFLIAAAAAAADSVSREVSASPPPAAILSERLSFAPDKAVDRIVDMHVHFDEKMPNFIGDLLKLSDRLNLTACVLTPFAHRKVIANAAKQHPTQIIPFGFIDLDAPNAVQQVKELRALGYRGLGELNFVRRPYTDPLYMPVYELANQYQWIVLFHTGIVMRAKFDESEDVASYRMRAFYLEEIARRFPKIMVLGAHCGNPEYEWAAEVARWNPNVFFDLSGSTLTKMRGHLDGLQKHFWWSGAEWGANLPDGDSSAFSKLVFGSDTSLDGIEGVLAQYRAMFGACDVPSRTQKLILGGTLAKVLGLPE